MFGIEEIGDLNMYWKFPSNDGILFTDWLLRAACKFKIELDLEGISKKNVYLKESGKCYNYGKLGLQLDCSIYSWVEICSFRYISNIISSL